jgi:hypothetical protein
MQITWPTLIARPRWHGGPAGQHVDDTLPLRTLSTLCAQRSSAKGNIMSATQFGLGLLLYIAVAVICYAAGWWQAKTVRRDQWEERGAAQDQLVQRDQQGREPEVLVPRQPLRAQ